jgi:hypothetical protein
MDTNNPQAELYFHPEETYGLTAYFFSRKRCLLFIAVRLPADRPYKPYTPSEDDKKKAIAALMNWDPLYKGRKKR